MLTRLYFIFCLGALCVNIGIPVQAISAPREYKIYTPEELILAIKEVIKRDSGIPAEDLAHIEIPPLSPIRSPKEAKLDTTVAGEMRGGRLPVELNLIVDNQSVRRQRIFVSIDLFATAWTTSRDLEAGSVITQDDIKQNKLASRLIKRDVITDPKLAIGSITKRSLPLGSPLKKGDLTIPKLVNRGALITLVFNKGGISLSAEGEALGDGRRGDIVRVKNLKSKKIVSGRVIGVNQVDVGR